LPAATVDDRPGSTRGGVSSSTIWRRAQTVEIAAQVARHAPITEPALETFVKLGTGRPPDPPIRLGRYRVLRWAIAISDEVRVMMAPRSAYRRLATELPQSPPFSLGLMVRRPALAALVIGGAVALTSTGGATVRALVTTTICWSFVPGVQMIVAAGLIALWRRPGLRLCPAVDLFFAGQGPWLLWTLGVAAAALVAFGLGGHAVPHLFFLLLVALVPLVWTAIIIFAFCREVLELDGRRAFVWMLLYESAIWGIAYLYASAMTFQAWPFGQMRL
jgi:hypothetical protein